LGCTVERREDKTGLVQLRASSALIDIVPVDSELGRPGGAAPTAETSIIFACASSRLTKKRSAATLPDMASRPAH
jgi:hypothetical protein